MIDAKWYTWIYPLVYVLFLLKVEGLFVDITYVESAVAKGAVCLDGSAPAYHLSRGFGTGVNSWLVHMEGGGWCNNVTTCLARKNTRLGSSKQMLKLLAFSGILSNEEASNPDFYNWNRVKVRYCDGSSFTGDVERVNPATKLHYRGARVWLAVMEDLLANGMSNAENALLSGCSAGGLTSILHCDSFRALLPMGAKVKCLSDAGYFVNVKDIAGEDYIRTFFNDVVTTHGSAKNLPSSCTSRLAPPMCFFPQYSIQLIRTPLFIPNAAYDSWQHGVRTTESYSWEQGCYEMHSFDNLFAAAAAKIGRGGEEGEKDDRTVIAEIWGLSEQTLISDEPNNAENFFQSKLLDVFKFYLVSTMPDQELKAFVDHDVISRTIDANVSEAERIYSALEKLRIVGAFGVASDRIAGREERGHESEDGSVRI